MAELNEQQKKFIDEYLQSYSIEESALRAGFKKDEALQIGINLLANDIIQSHLKAREKELESLNSVLKMDKNKLLLAMYYQYNKAARRNDTKNAIDILEKIARWSGVNPDEVVLEPVQLIINNVDETKI